MPNRDKRTHSDKLTYFEKVLVSEQAADDAIELYLKTRDDFILNQLTVIEQLGQTSPIFNSAREKASRDGDVVLSDAVENWITKCDYLRQIVVADHAALPKYEAETIYTVSTDDKEKKKAKKKPKKSTGKAKKRHSPGRPPPSK